MIFFLDYKIKELFYAFLFILCFCSCNDSDKRLSHVEILMDKTPDTCLAILNRMEKQLPVFSRADAMKYLLLRTEVMNKLLIRIDTVSYMPQVLDYYKSHGTKKEQIMAFYLMGCVYRDRNNAQLALEYFLEAVEFVEKNNKKDILDLQAIVYGQIGYEYFKQRLPGRALYAWKKCRSLAMQAGDTVLALQGLEHCGYAYELLNNTDSAVNTAKRVYHGYMKNGNRNYAATSVSTLTNYYLQCDSLEKAKSLIDEYFSFSGIADESGNLPRGQNLFYYYFANYYERKNNLDSAKFYYRKLINTSGEFSCLENGFKGLMSIYSKIGNADSIAKYANLYADANDSANFTKAAVEMNRMQAAYDYSESKKHALEQETRANHLTLLLACIVLVVILIFFLVFFLTKRRHDRRKEEMRKVNEKYTDTLMKYKKTVEDIGKIKENFDKYKSEKKNEIVNLRNALSAFTEHSDDEDWDAEQMLLKHGVVVRLHKHAARGE